MQKYDLTESSMGPKGKWLTHQFIIKRISPKISKMIYVDRCLENGTHFANAGKTLQKIMMP